MSKKTDDNKAFVADRVQRWNDSYGLVRCLRQLAESDAVEKRDGNTDHQLVYFLTESADHIGSLWNHTADLHKEYCKATGCEFVDPNDNLDYEKEDNEKLGKH